MRKFPALAVLALAASCAAPERAPPPAPPPPPSRPAPPPPPPAPVSLDWRDWPLTPGSWVYVADAGGSSAMFGRSGGEAELILRCDRATRKIILSWPAALTAGAASATITTSSGSASYSGWGGIGTTARVGLTFPTNDPFLDKLAFSRGRFVLAKAPSTQPGDRLVIPAWPEPARAVEDCRK
jgi:hypothetical protein